MAGRSLSLPVNSVSSGHGARRHSALQSFGFRRKSEIEIVLEGNDDFIHTYSTFDEIKGHVNIQFEKDTGVDDLHVFFLGQTDTWVERMAGASPRSGRALAKHIFLRMQQPIPSNIFPESNIAKAGVTYTIPFTFVVPDRLLPFICCHKVANQDVKNQHLLLPPSIGEDAIAGEGSILMDDLAPNMSKIVYSIRVRLAKASPASRQQDILSESLRVRVIPTRDEEPPVSIDGGPRECMKFRLRKERDMRKGLFRIGKKQGRLTAETSQPKSIYLVHPGKVGQEAPSTVMKVQLRYDPAAQDEQPPQLSSIVTKLKSLTFFGATAFQNMPNASKYDVYSAYHGHYPQTMDLSTMNLSSVGWIKHETGTEATSVTATSGTQREGGAASTSRRPSLMASMRRMSVGTTKANSNPAPGSRQSHGKEPNPSEGRRQSTVSNISEPSSDSSTPVSNQSSSSLSSSTTHPRSATSTGNTVTESMLASISPSTSYNPAFPYYTTSITVPVSLPAPMTSGSTQSQASKSTSLTSGNLSSDPGPYKLSKSKQYTFLPTFYSCLVSRTYSLDLTVSTSGPSNPNISLHVPVQLNLKPCRQHSGQYQQAGSGIRETSDGIVENMHGFYNPFQPPPTGNSNANNAQLGGYPDDDMFDIRNDEAIARRLARSASYSNYPTASSAFAGRRTHPTLSEEDEDQANLAEAERIPTYAEAESRSPPQFDSPPPPISSLSSNSDSNPYYTLSPETSRIDPSSTAAATTYQPPSGPPPSQSLTSTSTSSSAPPASTTNANTASQPPPPEYYSSFRRTSSALASELASTSLRDVVMRRPRRTSTQNSAATGVINTDEQERPRTARRESASSRLSIRKWI